MIETQVIFDHFNYIAFVILMMIGFFTVVTSHNPVKKLMGMMVFQTSVLLMYISAAFVDYHQIPIIKEGITDYVNPLPHVLMLTAIVVGISTVAVGLAVVVRIKEEYGTIEDDEILEIDRDSLLENKNTQVLEEKA